jgi:glycosyltransferase involved in cell wall biosynthesis
MQPFPKIEPVAEGIARPFWSVAIPAFNRPDFLREALGSVLRQDPGPRGMQILVVDDGSAQSLQEVVKSVGGERVEFFRNEINQGFPETINRCVSESRGHWIHLLHDDDWVLPGFYSTFEKSLAGQAQRVGVGCCRYANVDERGNRVWESKELRAGAGILENFLSRIAISNFLNPPAVVFRREVFEQLGGFFPELTYTADWEFYKRAAVQFDWWYEPEILACYRVHSASETAKSEISAKQTEHFRWAIEISESYLPADIAKKLTDEARRCYSLLALKHAEDFLRMGQSQAALAQIREGLKISRTNEIVELARRVLEAHGFTLESAGVIS